MQLQPYLGRFAEENLLVLSTEGLKDAPTATLQTVYRFLEVDPTVQNRRTGRRFNSAAKKKLGPWTRWLSDQVPQHMKDRVRPYLPLHWLPGERVACPDVTSDLRTRLEDALRPDAEALRSLTGRDFEKWSV
jgi:hypothetical protein